MYQRLSGVMLMFAILATGSRAQLYISEMVEGTAGNLKWVEIFNAGASSVNLASPQLSLRLFANGTGTATATINLTGTLAPGAFYIVANNQADITTYHSPSFTASLTAGGLTPNGNDALQLWNGTSALDTFGGDWIGSGTATGTQAADGSYFRIASALPNNGNFGNLGGTTIADGATSASGFWQRRALTASNGNVSTVSTPFAAGVGEVPVELSVFSAE